jgi:hypothetical protein
MRKIVFFLVALLVLGAGGAAFWYFTHQPQSVPAAAAATNNTPYNVPQLTQAYSNSQYNFSLMLPADFTVQEVPSSDTDNPQDTLLFQNSTGDGIQIVISPFDEDTGSGYVLTKDRILKDVPDLAITNEQAIQIGPNYQGLAFESNNDAFGGASREVWFVFKGNLYQISTYQRLDPLLKAIFATWKFQ